MEEKNYAGLEQSLARTETDAEATLTAANKVVSSIKKFRDAAKKGKGLSSINPIIINHLWRYSIVPLAVE